MKLKIIHILPHNIYKFYPRIKENINELSFLDHHSTKFISNIILYDKENLFEHELWVIGDTKNIFEIKYNLGFKIKVFPQDFNIFLPLETSFSILKEIKKEINNSNGQQKIWHIHSYYLWMFDFIVIYLKLKKQVILAHHRGGGFTYKALPYSIYKYFFVLPIILRFCNEIFVQNKIEFNRLKNRYLINEKKLLYFPNTINIESNNRNTVGDTINLCFIGRLEIIKGIYDILDSIKNLKDNNISFKITFIGDGTLKNYIENFSIKNNFNYEITGWISNANIENILKSQNICLIANKKAEGSSNSVLEAQAFGLPVISYNIEGISDFVINNKTGFLVNNLSDYKNKLLYLCKNHNLIKSFSINSIENIKQYFSKDKYFNDLIEIYKKTV